MTQPSTRQIHHAYEPPEGFEAVLPPVHKASTILFADTQALRSRAPHGRRGYAYGTHGTPTTYILEQRIATLEGGTHCLLASSGLAAISLVNLALLGAGDEVLLPHNVYGPSKEQARAMLSRWGITHRLYDPMDPATLEAAITPHTRLVWLEAPGSITMEFPPLDTLIGIARRAQAVVALDDTWGTGLAFAPFDLGVDIAMQALTKYPSGGGDVLMGAVVTRDDALNDKLAAARAALGFSVGPNECEGVLRGLPSIQLRYEAQDRAARDLAAWLSTRPEVARVLHPALPGSPGHEHWARLSRGAAGLFSVMLDARYTQAQADAFVDALALFGHGYSWAGPMSLAVPYDLAMLRGGQAPWPGHLVRLSIGLEGVEDLRADLAQALQRAFGG
jgi:cystathionine beta-lyase